MPWEAHQDLSGKSYEINRDSIYRILRSHARAQATHNNTTTRRETNVFGPDLVTVDVDWAKVRTATDTSSKDLYKWFEQSIGDMDEVTTSLYQMLDYTKWYNNEVVMKQQDASRETMRNIDKSVGSGEIFLKGAEVVRDLSAETLLIGATMLSGGAALAFLA